MRSSAIIDSSGGDRKERACDSLIMCIVTTLNQGLRNGGGIGDILRAPSSQVHGDQGRYFFKLLLKELCTLKCTLINHLWQVCNIVKVCYVFQVLRIFC